MNTPEAEKILSKVRKRKLANGTDLKVAIAGTDYAVHFIFLFIFLLLTTNIGTFNAQGSTEIIVRSSTLVIEIVCLVFSIYCYVKMKNVRDYLVNYQAQYLDDITRMSEPVN